VTYTCAQVARARTHIYTLRRTDTRANASQSFSLPKTFPSVAARLRRGRLGTRQSAWLLLVLGPSLNHIQFCATPRQHLIAKEVGGRAGEGRAYANLGISYQSMGAFSKAIEYHTQCLAIAKEVGDQAGRARHTGTSATRTSLGTLSKAIKYTRSTWRLQRRWTTGRGRARRTRASAIATCTYTSQICHLPQSTAS
jgi:hypothetical protein